MFQVWPLERRGEEKEEKGSWQRRRLFVHVSSFATEGPGAGEEGERKKRKRENDEIEGMPWRPPGVHSLSPFRSRCSREGEKKKRKDQLRVVIRYSRRQFTCSTCPFLKHLE